MSSNQLSAPHNRISSPVLIGIVAVVFALGALTGLGVPRLLDGATYAFGAKGATTVERTFTGVADNNMSDAARRATYGATTVERTFTGVADNNMSDAARRATYGATNGEIGGH
jgi:hypothetical protein